MGFRLGAPPISGFEPFRDGHPLAAEPEPLFGGTARRRVRRRAPRTSGSRSRAGSTPLTARSPRRRSAAGPWRRCSRRATPPAPPRARRPPARRPRAAGRRAPGPRAGRARAQRGGGRGLDRRRRSAGCRPRSNAA